MRMSRRNGVLWILLSVLVCGMVFGATTYTYNPGLPSVWYTCGTEGSITQSFVVPEGQKLTEVSFYFNDGGYTGPAAGALYLFRGNYGLTEWNEYAVQVAAMSFPATGGVRWVTLPLSVPAPSGTYYVRAWSGDATYNSKLKGLLYTGSDNYSGGRAARSASGTTLFADNQDFAAKFKTEVIPEEAVYCLKNGRFENYQLGNERPYGWDGITQAGTYNFTMEPAGQYIQGGESAVAITAVSAGSAYWKQSIDIIPGNYTLKADVYATSPAIARLSAGGSQSSNITNTGWQQVSLDFSGSGSTDVGLWSLGGGTVKFRRVSVDIRSLTSSAVPFGDGTTLGKIVISAGATIAEKFAAYELQRCIYKMTGLTPPLDGRDTTYSGRSIIIGSAVDAAIISTLSSRVPDSYNVSVNGDGNICLAGNNDRGTLYAVYDFLKLQGCGWFLPGQYGEVVPTKSSLDIVDGSRIESPDYNARGLVQGVHRYDVNGNLWDPDMDDYLDWCLRNRINTLLWGEYPYTVTFGKHRGGGHFQGAGHTYDRFMMDIHPDWWPIVGGVPTKLNSRGAKNNMHLSDQELRDYVTNDAIQFFAANPDADAYALNAGDSTCWCECAFCRAFDSDFGLGPWTQIDNYTCAPSLGMADRSVEFTNDIAQRVNAIFPGKKVEMYAYSSTRTPPSRFMVDPDLSVWYTWHSAPVNRPISDMNNSVNVYHNDNLTGWQNQGASQFNLYSYANFYYRSIPMFWYYHQADYLKTFNEQWGFDKCLGEFSQQLEFSAMLFHLRSLSYWDVDTDYMEEMHKACNLFYGPAATWMFEYYKFMQNQELQGSTWQNPDAAEAQQQAMVKLADFNIATMVKGTYFLDSAWASAGSDEALLQRIAMARIGHAMMTVRVCKIKKASVELTSEEYRFLSDAFVLGRQLCQRYDVIYYHADWDAVDTLNTLWFSPSPGITLANKSFESGDLSGWTTSGSPCGVQDLAGDSNWSSLATDASTKSFWTEANGQLLSHQTYHVIAAGCTYTLSADLGILSGSFDRVSMALWAFGEGDPVLMTNRVVTRAEIPTGSFEPFSKSYTDDGTLAGRMIVIQFQFLGGGRPSLDNVILSSNCPTGRSCGDQYSAFLTADISGPEGTPDCIVDLFDLGKLLDEWLVADAPEVLAGDIFGVSSAPDGHVNFLDYAFLAEEWFLGTDPVAGELPVLDNGILVNGTFETADSAWGTNPIGWDFVSTNGGYTIAVDAGCPDGGAKALLYSGATNTSASLTFDQLTNKVIESGKTYTLSMDVGSQNYYAYQPEYPLATVTVKLYAETTGGIRNQIASIASVGTDFTADYQWKTYSVSYAATGTYVGRKLRVSVQFSGKDYGPFVDSVRLYEMP